MFDTSSGPVDVHNDPFQLASDFCLDPMGTTNGWSARRGSLVLSATPGSPAAPGGGVSVRPLTFR